MLQQLPSWRDLLSSLEVEEKRRIIKALGIQEKTWERWVRGNTALPHLGRIRELLRVLPTNTQAQFLACLERDPKFAKYEIDQLIPAKRRDISSTFYSHFLEANVVTPEPLRFMTLCQLILIEMVGHLDPDSCGIYVAILRCTPPVSDQSVRTQSQYLALGTPPWSKVLQFQHYFLGAESLAGRAILTLRPYVLQDPHCPEEWKLLSVYQDGHTASGAAVPILKQGQSAGCFVILSAQPNFFTAHVLTILQRYCELMAIAMRDDEWYTPGQFALHVMPPASTQQAYLASFFNRVSMQCKNQADGPLANSLQAERVVSQQIEAELISLVSQK
jgi:GAF domain